MFFFVFFKLSTCLYWESDIMDKRLIEEKQMGWDASFIFISVILDNIRWLTTFSLQDLLQIQSGALFKLIKDVTKFASSHVYDCPLCCQKGFVCEICRNPKVIYPFEVDTTVRVSEIYDRTHFCCVSENCLFIISTTNLIYIFTRSCPEVCLRWKRG